MTHPINESTTSCGEVTLSQAPGNQDNPQPATQPEHVAISAEVPAQPHPKPCPKPCPVTHPINESTTSPGEGTSSQAPGIQDNPQLATQSEGRVPATIDPLLLAASNQPFCAFINTSDNLALQEATRFSVTGKHIPKKKQQC